MVTVGGGVPVPVPIAIREMVSPSVAKAILVIASAGVVGVKRTLTAWDAPSPTSLNGLPETTLKGAEVDTVPETNPAPVFDTVNT